jgi:ribosome biogenesis GTPase
VANVDTVLIVLTLTVDVNRRLLERYLGTVRSGGAEPVVVLSKADLYSNPHEIAGRIAAAIPGVGVHALSAVTGEGLEQLMPYIGSENTIVLVGPSGAGKSTIINKLLASDVQATQEIRSSDGRGRHTTTSRRLFTMAAGGVLIDTPGLRELHLWDGGGLDDTFVEIGELAGECRFRDCQHQSEPGCAVQHAIASGTLEPERFENYNKIKREIENLEMRRDLAARSEQRRRWKQVTKAMRRHNADKYKED